MPESTTGYNTYIDDLINQLTTMGFELPGGLESITQITPEQISTNIGAQFGLEPGDIPSSLFQPITGDLLQGLTSETYRPSIESAAYTGLSDMRTKYQKPATQAFGNFAGSMHIDRFKKMVKDVYGQHLTPALTTRQQGQQQSLKGISDLVNQWSQTGLEASNIGV